MKKLLLVSAVALCLSLTACATNTPLNLPEAWRPANTFDETPRVIALSRPYAYQIFSVDRTLLQLTRRWAKDTQIGFDYACDDDFSLPARLEGESYRDVDSALRAINSVYKSFGVVTTLNAQNKLTTKCTNRDVVTGIARLNRDEKPPAANKESKPLLLQSTPRLVP
jgi:predicted small lipoprotein YifL